MTKLIFFILLRATTSPSVKAGDVKDSRWDMMDFCNQFVIRDPDPDSGFRLGHHRYCHLDDWNDNRGAPLALIRRPGTAYRLGRACPGQVFFEGRLRGGALEMTDSNGSRGRTSEMGVSPAARSQKRACIARSLLLPVG
jgi:hypothetical protein